MIHRCLALSTALLLACATAAAAQQPTSEDRSRPAMVQVGPFSVRPVFLLRDVGFDSNVFNESEDPQSDFTATMGAKVDVGMRLPRLQGTYTSSYEYLYFQSIERERSSNRGVEGRVDALLGRFRPYAAAGISNTHDRPTSEIDERAHRQQSHVEIGLRAAAFSRTFLNVGYRRTGVEYADDELFRGVSLAEALNATGETVRFGADMELTPLTTVSLDGERAQDRFDLAPGRDASSYRFGVTATLNPLALISGRASIGVRAFRPRSAQVADFTGLTAAIAVGYSLGDDMRLNVALDRDLRYSFDQITPYYVSTGGRVTVTRQLIGNFDGQVFAGAERIAYEARLDAPVAADTDSVRIFGTGVGYRLGDGARVAINFDHTARSSPAADREHTRGRLYTTLTYGF
ncbi:MAG: outer membrane beta-barrel protein [Vicinamibacterales bacterium]